MIPPTRSSLDSSRSFAASADSDFREDRGTWRIRPARSRLIPVWHVGVHALAAAAIALSGLAWPLELAAFGALAAHAVWRWPGAPVPICRHADGTWSLPALGLEGLVLCPGTEAGPFWVRLSLGRADARAVTVVLVADQLDRESWRRLQAELRRRVGAGTV